MTISKQRISALIDVFDVRNQSDMAQEPIRIGCLGLTSSENWLGATMTANSRGEETVDDTVNTEGFSRGAVLDGAIGVASEAVQAGFQAAIEGDNPGKAAMHAAGKGVFRRAGAALYRAFVERMTGTVGPVVDLDVISVGTESAG